MGSSEDRSDLVLDESTAQQPAGEGRDVETVTAGDVGEMPAGVLGDAPLPSMDDEVAAGRIVETTQPGDGNRTFAPVEPSAQGDGDPGTQEPEQPAERELTADEAAQALSGAKDRIASAQPTNGAGLSAEELNALRRSNDPKVRRQFAEAQKA